MKTENQTIDSFPYMGDENPLDRNKAEFKGDAIILINEWEMPAIHAMYPNDFIKCTELKAAFDKFKREMLISVINL